MQLTETQRSDYQQDGFLVLRQALLPAALDGLEQGFLGLVDSVAGRRFETTQSPGFAELLLGDRELERTLYDDVRRYPWLAQLGSVPEITAPVAQLLAEPIGLMSKIPFRIDLPGVVRELAVWHQDYFYVQGNVDIVTAWVPLQDTPYVRGCLMVMPGSHRLGPLPHDSQVLGKRHFPSGVFDREVRYVEMRRGDLLLFHSMLLHSSGFNMSSTGRLSIQARYSALSAPTHAAMGELIPV